MAAKVVTVSHGLIWEPEELQRLWFFPDGSEYLRYAPHFHLIYQGGFRQNLPLIYSFVIVMEGKLSIKNYYGTTEQKIVVRDEVWFYPGVWNRATGEYAKMLRKGAYSISRR
jgi:hypothetical protein